MKVKISLAVAALLGLATPTCDFDYKSITDDFGNKLTPNTIKITTSADNMVRIT